MNTGTVKNSATRNALAIAGMRGGMGKTVVTIGLIRPSYEEVTRSLRLKRDLII